MNAVKIFLADDHRLVREGFRAILNRQPGWTVVGETGHGLEVVDRVEELHPDVLLLDIMMPGLNGLEVARRLSQKRKPPKIIFLSMHAEESYVATAFLNGASGYLLKNNSSDELVRAIQQVLSGQRYLSASLDESTLQDYLKRAKETGQIDPYSTLTKREREVLQLSAEGYTNAEMGARLFISTRTVETHRANLMHKLGLRSQADLVRFAFQRKIIPLDPQKPE